MYKKWIVIGVAFFVSSLYAQSLLAAPQAISVLAEPSDPTACHSSYSGAEITLKGIARGDSTEYMWDFGDGTSTAWSSITDPYNLGVKHSYTGIVGQKFEAHLKVRNALGEIAEDRFRVELFESFDPSIASHLNVRIRMAIAEGLWYLHTNLQRGTYGADAPGYGQAYGYWIDTKYGYHLAATGAAIDSFQVDGSRVNGDFDNDPYVETVQRAMNYILVNTYSFPIGVQLAGNPDTNGNGIGLVSNHSSLLTDSRQTYIGGICLTSIASSGAPNYIAPVGQANVYGRTLSEIVQDMVDFFAWGQVDSNYGVYRGGWRYWANYSSSDMSTTQWPPLGMVAAEENMQAVIPDFVATELEYFLNYTQNTDLNDNNGGFGYYNTTLYLNITKAAAGLICHHFLGTPLDDERMQKAIGYIYRHWDDAGTSWDDTQLHGNSYGMYGVMKAFRIPEPDIFSVTEYDYLNDTTTDNTFDWFFTPAGQLQEGLATYSVRTQQADGSWDDTVGPNTVLDAFATGWQVSVLNGVIKPTPKAAICYCDELEYNLDMDISLSGACSYHTDPNRTIVKYEWDFDHDGVFEVDDEGVDTVIAGGYSEEGFYPVALRVTDDRPEILGGAQTDITTCTINVHPPPHVPHAIAGGPYEGWPGIPLVLDGSASWDPDNEIVAWDWDVDNDGLFGAEDNDCFGLPSDAVGEITEWTWEMPYSGIIGLRVTDADNQYPASQDFDYTCVEIGNHPPTADPGGPYIVFSGETIVLDGCNSFDPDPDAILTFAWDLDNDGAFDDGDQCDVVFVAPEELGQVVDVCLEVSDEYGLSDRACTSIEVVENRAPVAVIGEIPDLLISPMPVSLKIAPQQLTLSNTGAWFFVWLTTTEGSTEAVEVCLDGTQSYDPDNDELDYDWLLTDESGEIPLDSNLLQCIDLDPGSYSAVLTVSDGLTSSDATENFTIVEQTIADLMDGDFTLNGEQVVEVAGCGNKEDCVLLKFDRVSILQTLEIGVEQELVLEGTTSANILVTVRE